MSKKICYISEECYLDSDVEIIKELNRQVKLYWYVFFRKKSNVDYTPTKIESYSKQHLIANISIISLKNRLRNLKIIWEYVQILKTIKKEKPDVIYIDMLGMPYFFLCVFFILGTKNVVYAVHDLKIHYKHQHYYFIDLSQKFIFMYFKHFHLLSRWQLNIFKQKYPKKNCFYSGICLKDFGSSNKIPPKGKIRFLFFGTIRKNKGLQYLIEAVNKLSIEFKNEFVVSIAGVCDEWHIYEKLIKDPSVFDLQIKLIPNQDIPDLFCSSHYIVLPYIDVTQSGPLLIAYNYGIPAIASNLEGFKEYIEDNKTGYLFKSQDSEDLYRVLKKILLTKNSNYKFMTQNLGDYIKKNISTEHIVNKYLDYFNRITEKQTEDEKY
ncbi:MAG: glycosyltransferase family 4 protein [Bacteroidota bacterium]|nr:glycosyltransferase family 4 protein [Bacteroidota bacterium]